MPMLPLVPSPLTVPALRTVDKASGEKPTDQEAGAQALTPTNAHRRNTQPNMVDISTVPPVRGVFDLERNTDPSIVSWA